MLRCLDDKYSLGEENSGKMSSKITSIETGLRLLGQSRSHLVSKRHIKVLAKAEPNGDPTATPSTCV